MNDINAMPIHQGDVGLFPCHPVDGKRLDTLTLAYGEVTGHHHTLTGDCAVLERSSERFVSVGEAGAVLTHQEHGEIKLAPGTYEVKIHREFSWADGVRKVAD